MAAPSSEDKIRAKLELIYSRCVTSLDGCLLMQEGSQTKSGYPRYHLRYPEHGEVNTTLHRAVYIMEHRRPELIRNQAGGEVSHRCGQKACVKLDHLVLETSAKNNYRKECHRCKKCYGCSPPCIIRK